MILSKTDSAPQRESAVSHENQNDLRLQKGEFVGLVESCEAGYRFLVRGLRREGPTIQGTGVDFASAVKAVRQLLDALADHTVLSGTPANSR